jgi:hypothetical protein
VIKHEGSLEEWMNSFTHERRGYMKKPRGRALWVFWWEPESDPEEEYWFCNLERRQSKNAETKGVWVIRKDLPNHLRSHLEDEGYELFLDEE